MGIGSESQHQNRISEQDFNLANHLLEQIKACFKDAERLSEKFKNDTIGQTDQSDDLLTHDPQSDLDPQPQRLRLPMRKHSTKRQSGTNIVKKTTWALYEKKRLDTLISDVSGFVNQLVELFPSIQDNQKLLCNTEVSAVGDTRDLAMLKEVASSNDPYLEAPVTKEMESRGHVFTDWKADGKSKIRARDDNAFGVEIKSHHYSRFSVSGNTDIRLGNVNRGQ